MSLEKATAHWRATLLSTTPLPKPPFGLQPPKWCLGISLICLFLATSLLPSFTNFVPWPLLIPCLRTQSVPPAAVSKFCGFVLQGARSSPFPKHCFLTFLRGALSLPCQPYPALFHHCTFLSLFCPPPKVGLHAFTHLCKFCQYLLLRPIKQRCPQKSQYPELSQDIGGGAWSGE